MLRMKKHQVKRKIVVLEINKNKIKIIYKKLGQTSKNSIANSNSKFRIRVNSKVLPTLHKMQVRVLKQKRKKSLIVNSNFPL